MDILQYDIGIQHVRITYTSDENGKPFTARAIVKTAVMVCVGTAPAYVITTEPAMMIPWSRIVSMTEIA